MRTAHSWPLTLSIALALLLITLDDASSAAITLSYDVLAGAKDDAGTVPLFLGSYNVKRAQRDPVPTDAAQSFSFSASVSGSNTFAGGLGYGNNAATVDASASIDYALMRAKVYGTGSTDSARAAGQSNQWAAVDGGLILASTRDALLLQSATLPMGAAAEFEIGLYFHAVTGVTGGPPGDVTRYAGFTQTAPVAELSFNGSRFAVESWVNPEQTFQETFVYTRPVGSTFPLNFDLKVQGGLNAVAPFGGGETADQSSGFADATATARVSVRILTPGVSYVADSGSTYPVPEPATWALWLAGGIGLVAFSRRRDIRHDLLDGRRFPGCRFDNLQARERLSS